MIPTSHGRQNQRQWIVVSHGSWNRRYIMSLFSEPAAFALSKRTSPLSHAMQDSIPHLQEARSIFKSLSASTNFLNFSTASQSTMKCKQSHSKSSTFVSTRCTPTSVVRDGRKKGWYCRTRAELFPAPVRTECRGVVR
jgi:hypothetical protein